jgi:hypothetical protein
MLNISKNHQHAFARKVAAATAVAAVILSNTVAAQAVPSTNACSKISQARIAAFRTQISADTVGTIAVLTNANTEGNDARTAIGGSAAGGWNYIAGLRQILAAVDETAFEASPCKSLFYPWGQVVPNNINACFRVYVTPLLEHEMYWTTLHSYYNHPTYTSRPSAVAAFNATRDLLKASRNISNDAVTCMFEEVRHNEYGPLSDPN